MHLRIVARGERTAIHFVQKRIHLDLGPHADLTLAHELAHHKLYMMDDPSHHVFGDSAAAIRNFLARSASETMALVVRGEAAAWRLAIRNFTRAMGRGLDQNERRLVRVAIRSYAADLKLRRWHEAHDVPEA